MQIKTSRTLFLLGLLSVPVASFAQGEFQQGIKAFRDTQYSRALDWFLAAEQKGNDSATLTYNIAVTYYQLGHYANAEQAFQRLVNNPEWADLARFQLGLVAEKQGDRSRAIDLYRKTQSKAASPKLRRLAANRLAKLEPSKHGVSPSKPWTALVSVATGFDDNAFNLQDDIQVRSSAGEDSYLEYFAWGQHTLQGTASDGWRLQGFGYGRRYADFNDLDLDIYSLGVSRDIPLQTWQAEFGLAAVITKLDGEDLTDQTKLLARIKRGVGRSQISLGYLPSYYEGGSDFGHLDGWQHVVETNWQYPLRAVSLNAFYRLELNDREDKASDNEFFSYSPTRHSVGLGLDWRVQARWHLSAGFEYRASDYEGTNRLTDSDGVFKEKTRDGDRVKMWLKTRVQVSDKLRLTGRVSVTDNEENFDTYTYDKNQASVGAEYIF